VPDWRSMASTRVVLPWSTWAMMAMLKMGLRASLAAGLGAGTLAGTGESSMVSGFGMVWGLLTAWVVLFGRVEIRPKGENARHL